MFVLARGRRCRCCKADSTPLDQISEIAFALKEVVDLVDDGHVSIEFEDVCYE